MISEYMEDLCWNFSLLFSLLAFKQMEVVAFLLELPACSGKLSSGTLASLPSGKEERKPSTALWAVAARLVVIIISTQDPLDSLQTRHGTPRLPVSLCSSGQWGWAGGHRHSCLSELEATQLAVSFQLCL